MLYSVIRHLLVLSMSRNILYFLMSLPNFSLTNLDIFRYHGVIISYDYHFDCNLI